MYKKLYINVKDNFCCCTDCPLVKDIDGKDYCQHPKSAGEVTEYYNEQTGYHPKCPLPSIPKNINSNSFIENILNRKSYSKKETE